MLVLVVVQYVSLLEIIVKKKNMRENKKSGIFFLIYHYQV